MNESSSEPSVKLTTELVDNEKSPLNTAVSKAVPSLLPVLSGGYMLELKGRLIVPVPVWLIAECIVRAHHSSSWVVALTMFTPGAELETTGRPSGPSVLPAATLGVPLPPKSGAPVPCSTWK